MILKKKFKRLIFILASAVLLFAQILPMSASAKLVSKVIPDEAAEYDGHYYMLYDDVGMFDGASWEKANKFCKKRGGYLASINNADENDFLVGLMSSSGVDSAFIGLSYNGGWSWASGEKYDFTAWKKKSPSDESGEPYGILGSSGKWKNGSFGSGGTAYICEWDSGAKISEADVDDALKFVKEKTSERFRDSYYRVFNYPLDRSDAAKLCLQLGGHLVSIQSKEEQKFVKELIAADGKRNMYWIGAYSESGKWYWHDGSTLDDYSAWTKEKLNNYAGDARFAVFNSGSSKYDKNSWVAEPAEGETKSGTEDEYCINYGFVCEWELICTYENGRSIAHTDGEWKTEKESTCTETGVRSLYCQKCGQLVRSMETSKKPHTYDECPLIGKLRIPGIKCIRCTMCGKRVIRPQWGRIWIIPAAVIFYIVSVLSYNAARDEFEQTAGEKKIKVLTKRIPMKAFVIVPTALAAAVCVLLILI